MFTPLAAALLRFQIPGICLLLCSCVAPSRTKAPLPTAEVPIDRPSGPVKVSSTKTSKSVREWRATLPDQSVLRAIEIDREGDLILAPTMAAEGKIAGHLVPQGLSLIALKANGELRWQRHLSKSHEAIIRSIALKDDGSYFVAGTFAGSLLVDEQEIRSQGDRDAFVGLVSQEGKTHWLRSLGGFAREEATDIAISEDSELVTLGGWSESSFRFAGKDFSARGTARDGFVATFDFAGNPKWADRYQGVGVDEVHDVAYERDQLYVLGSFSTALRVNSQVRSSQGERDVFLVRYGADGEREWTRNWGSPKDDYGVALHIDKDASLTVVALVGADLQLDEFFSKALGKSDILLWTMNASGDVLASQRLGGKGSFVALGAEGSERISSLMGYYEGQGVLSHLQLPETTTERALHVEIGPALELVSAKAPDYQRLLLSKRRFGLELEVGITGDEVTIELRALIAP